MIPKSESIYDKPLAMVAEGLEGPVKDLLTLTGYCSGDRYLKELVYPMMEQLTAEVFEFYDRVLTLAEREEGHYQLEEADVIRQDYWFKKLKKKIQEAYDKGDRIDHNCVVNSMNEMYGL